MKMVISTWYFTHHCIVLSSILFIHASHPLHGWSNFSYLHPWILTFEDEVIMIIKILFDHFLIRWPYKKFIIVKIEWDYLTIDQDHLFSLFLFFSLASPFFSILSYYLWLPCEETRRNEVSTKKISLNTLPFVAPRKMAIRL